MKNAVGWVGQVISWLVIFAMLAVLAVCVLVPRLGGGTPYTILTGSMSMSYPAGTLVVTRPADADQINIGDVVTYQIKTGEPTVVTHRVIGTTVAEDGSPRFITKGDSNSSPDRELVRPEQVRGTIWYAVPVLGRLNVLFDKAQHQLAVVLGGGALLLYAAFMFTSAALDKRRPERNRKKTEVLV